MFMQSLKKVCLTTAFVLLLNTSNSLKFMLKYQSLNS